MIEQNQVTTPSAPSAPAIDPYAMPLEELRKVAGIDAPAQATPFQQPQPAMQPSVTPASDAAYTLETLPDGNYQVKYATGEVFKGDINTILDQTAKAHVSTKRWALDRAQQQSANPQALPEAELSPEERQKVSQLLGEFITPEVKQHLASEGMAQVLGVPAEAVPQMVQGITKTVADYEANLLLMDFGQRCQGYLDTPENSTALHESLCTVLGGDPAENGYKPSVDDLEAAYALAVYRGKITPHDPQAAPVRQSRPPVMPTATSATLGAGGQNPWAMDMNQLAALAGVNGH